jgi:hypothetical protein
MSGLVVGIMLMLKISEDLRKVWNAFPGENAYFSNDAGNAPLWNLEMELLRYDPETEQYVMKPSGVRARKSQRMKGGDTRSRSRRPDTQSPGRSPGR